MIRLLRLIGCFDGFIRLVGSVVGTRGWFDSLLHVVDQHGSIGGFSRLAFAIGSCCCFMWLGSNSWFRWLVGSRGWSKCVSMVVPP